YWHMVSKLLLAVQECFFRAEDPHQTARLREAYDRVRGGLSAAKTPAEYGAFPTDPYSHTPGHRGAQQPGMTGQVKEEILTRWGELGVVVEGGQVRFSPRLVRVADLPDEGIDFTFCGVPIHYRRGAETRIRVHHGDGEVTAVEGDRLDVATSAALFARAGAIAEIEVTLA
ncbi:MAG: hypothetical protein KC731_30560, partial [Myxococcales bacterium]|nr:hypothetical protein [Myxococcales bacterium]